MVTTTREKNKQPSAVVNEELQRMRQQGRPPEGPKRPAGNAALGIVEIVLGAAIVIASFVAGPVFSLFLGAVLVLSGILEVINGSQQRAVPHIVVGILGALAGVYILANPLVTFSFISRAVGLYLVVSGAVSFFRARRAAASVAGAVIEVVIGLLALFSGINIGFLAGLYLVIRGIYTYNSRGRYTGTAA